MFTRFAKYCDNHSVGTDLEVIGKKLNLNLSCAKLLHFYQHYFHQTHVDQVAGEFQPKTSICNYYHSNGFYLILYVNNKPDNHFAALC